MAGFKDLGGGKYRISNINELEIVLNKRARKAMEITCEILLNKLLDIIDSKVYSTKEGDYKRSGQLKEKENWEISKITKYRTLNFVIEFVGNNYTFVHDKFQHSNNYGDNNEIKASDLLDIINEGWSSSSGLEPPYGFEPYEATKFWDEFLEYCDNNLNDLFQRNYDMLSFLESHS